MARFRHIIAPARSHYLAECYDYDAMVRGFERDAIGLIEKHPDVQFDIYFPPCSILQFVSMRRSRPKRLPSSTISPPMRRRAPARFPERRALRFSRGRGNHPRPQQLRRRDPSLAGRRHLQVLAMIRRAESIGSTASAPTASLDRLKAWSRGLPGRAYRAFDASSTQSERAARITHRSTARRPSLVLREASIVAYPERSCALDTVQRSAIPQPRRRRPRRTPGSGSPPTRQQR